MVRARVGEAAAGETDDEDATLERDALRRTVVGVTTDRVIDHVRAPTAGELLDRVDEVTGPVVDHQLSSEVPTHLDLLRSSGRRDHACACGQAELDRSGPHSPSSRVHKQRFSGLKIRPPMQRHVPGLVGHVQGRRRRVGERVRNREDGRDRRDRPLGETSDSELWNRDHAPAQQARVRTLAECDDRAGDFGSRRERQRRFHLVLTATHEDVGEVQ